jgi:hypothetical protein
LALVIDLTMGFIFCFSSFGVTILYHYNKSWFFKRSNLTKMFALTKRMYVFTKNMGHERHMVILVGFYD